MGFFDFIKRDKSIDNLATIVTTAIVMSEEQSFRVSNKGKFELFVFNVCVGWDLLLKNKLVNPTDSIIQSKIGYIVQKSHQFNIDVEPQIIYDIYMKRYKTFLDLSKCGTLMFVPYMYNLLYLTPLDIHIESKRANNIENEKLQVFSTDFLYYYSSLISIYKQRLSLSR